MDDQLLNEMFRSRDAAVGVALEALDRRLSSMNEFRALISDQSAKMATRVELLTAMQATDAKTVASFDTLRERIQSLGKPNYVLLGGFASIIIAMITGFWLILGLRIDAATAPVMLEIERIHGAITATNTRLDTSLAAANARISTQTP